VAAWIHVDWIIHRVETDGAIFFFTRREYHLPETAA
jgi:hypothetical protein